MYIIPDRPDWREARHKIKDAVAVGIDLNNTVTPSAVITEIKSDGFQVNIGGLRDINLKWSCLEYCWKDLCNEGIYDKSVFKNPFEQAFIDCDSLDFLMQRLLRRSGLLKVENKEQIRLPL